MLRLRSSFTACPRSSPSLRRAGRGLRRAAPPRRSPSSLLPRSSPSSSPPWRSPSSSPLRRNPSSSRHTGGAHSRAAPAAVFLVARGSSCTHHRIALEEPLIGQPQRSPSPRHPRGALHRAASEEPSIIPVPEEPFSIAPRRPGGAPHHAMRFFLQPLIAPPQRSPSPSLCSRGALHRAAWFFLEPLHRAAAEQPFHRAALHHAAPEEPFSTAPPQRSASSHRTVLLAALRCAAPEQPLRGACHRAAPEEPLIIRAPEELFIIAPRRRSPSTWLRRRSSSPCRPALLGALSPRHPGGGLSPRRRRGALHHAAWLLS